MVSQSASPTSVTGTSFAADAAKLPDWRARSRLMLSLAKNGFVPPFIRDNFWQWVASTGVIDGKVRTLRMVVSPDFVSVGNAADYLVFGPTPDEGQAIADLYDALLPSRKIANLIHDQAAQKLPLSDVKAPPENIPQANIETVPAVLAARRIDQRRGAAPQTQLVDGHRKSIVVGPNLDGSHVAIYGGQGGTVSGWAIQPYSTIHGSYYGDYSHGLRLVSRHAILDGVDVDLATMFMDPKLSVLVSDQGPFVPRFPNVGPNATPLPLARPNGPSAGSTGLPGGPVATKPPGLTPAINKPVTQTGSLGAVALAVVIAGLLARAAGGAG